MGGCRKFKPTRLLKYFSLIKIIAVVVYLIKSDYNSRSEDPPIRTVLRSQKVTQKAQYSFAGSDAMLDRIEIVGETCREDDVIRRADVLQFPAAKPAILPFHRYRSTNICMCKVPKVASTMFSKLLMASEATENMTYIQNILQNAVHERTVLSKYQHVKCGTSDSLKFMVVRNPYERIFSAYIDKIFLGKFAGYVAKMKYSEKINGSFRNPLDDDVELPPESVCKQHDVKFDSLLKVVLSSKRVEAHFAPIASFCNPCNNKFDVIIKLENIREEMKHVTQHLPFSMDTTTFTDINYNDTIRDLIKTMKGVLDYTMAKKQCQAYNSNFTFVNERFWDALKMQGCISRNERSDGVVFLPNSSAKEAFGRFKALKIPFLNSEQRSTQRHEYLVDAYKSLDADLLNLFKFRFHADFHLFGYSPDTPL